MGFNEIVSMVCGMLGGLALFLFGMHTLSNSLEKLAGGKLEKWLEKVTSSPIKGVALGAGVTALIQSSAATTVMLIGFVNSGISVRPLRRGWCRSPRLTAARA